MKYLSTILSICSLSISITAGILIYQQQQHIERLQQQLLKVSKLETEHAKAMLELTELVTRVAKDSTLDVQLNKMFESTKDEIQESGQQIFDSTMESWKTWEKFYSSAPE